jgi:ribosomal-protein-alanine N-acetyltransferase
VVPPIRTARLELVSFSLGAMRATLQSDLPTVVEELGAEVPDDLPDGLGGLFRLRIAQLEADPSGVPWLARAIVVTGHDGLRRLIGSIGFHAPPVDGVVEIGYNVEPGYRRRGIATEAVRAMLDWAAGQGVHSIRASVSPGNVASRAVIARFGFEQTGVQWDDEDGEELVFMTTWPPAADGPIGADAAAVAAPDHVA